MFKLNSEKFIQHLDNKWRNKTCVMCGESDWICDESIYTMMEVNEEKSVLIGGKVMPIVAVTCKNCGHTVLVNAILAKSIIDAPNESKGE